MPRTKKSKKVKAGIMTATKRVIAPRMLQKARVITMNATAVRRSRPKRTTGRRKRSAGGGAALFSGRGNSSLNGKRGRVIEEDEYIGEINGSTSATVPVTQSFAINPGQKTTFPWMAPQAASWEYYIIERIEFYYKPEVSVFATGGQTGKVVLTCDYDANDAPPATKQQAEDTIPHADAMAHTPIRLPLQKTFLHPKGRKYVRPGGVPGNADVTNYDGGNLNVLTFNNGTTGAIGELHVRYRVRFEVPVLESATTVPRNNQVSFFETTTTEASAATTVASQMLFATTTANGLSIVNTGGSFVPTAGNYLVSVMLTVADAGGGLSSQVTLAKNGTKVIVGTNLPGASTNQGFDGTCSFTYFVTANGTDAFTVSVTNAFAAGNPTNTGQIMWYAV